MLAHLLFGVVAIPEPSKIGMNLIAIIAFDVSHDYLNSALNMLKSRKDIKCLYVTSGRYDVIALMWFSSTEELYKFMEEEVANIEGIKNTETFICMRTVKSFWSTNK
jgi:Lrp/AsnC family transcriptional regulator for asnA, asnC and gidA